MRTYKVKVPVTVSITWRQELVEDKDNFYMRLKPHINLSGVKGAAGLTRVQTGGASRYVLTKAQNELLRQIKLDNEFKKEMKEVMKGKQPIKTEIKVKAPSAPRIQTQLSAEDFAAGAHERGAQIRESSRSLSTGWSEKDLEKLEKGE